VRFAFFSFTPSHKLNGVLSPIIEVYRSALAFASNPAFFDFAVTRAEYLEGGSHACRRKFPDWKSLDERKEKDKEKSGTGDELGLKKTEKAKGSTRRR
jgi:hypothetical protein